MAAIEALKPESGEGSTSASNIPGKPLDPAWRRNRLLELRYLEGASFEEVLRILNVSARQGYRDHAQAIQEVAALLWTKGGQAELAEASTW